MTKEKLIKLVANDLPHESLTNPTDYKHGGVDQWFDISDTRVSSVNFQEVCRKEAYLLFYERTQWTRKTLFLLDYEHGSDEKDRWFDISDTYVRELTDKEELFAKEAYLLFYERLA